jgi:hypothetical protein
MLRPQRAARPIAYTEQVSDEEDENEASTQSSEENSSDDGSDNSVSEDSEVSDRTVSVQRELISQTRMNLRSFRIPKS